MLLLAVPAGAVASEDVSFPDANLEAAVRDALRISEEGITVDDMATLSVLDADDRGISDLSGLEHAVNLRDLDLEDNEISDLGPLANLTNLRDLDLEDNEISDIGPLANLTNLRDLDLEGNKISDISPLANLTNLRDLGLEDNEIRDLGPLTNLTNLRDLDLEGNEISDIGPLVANSGLGSGDSVKVRHNNLDLTSGSAAMKDIEALERRGVDVDYMPQHSRSNHAPQQ